jgi:predicted phage-related endonuclease
MSDRPNIPVPDELAQVRDQIRSLTEREEELRRLLLNNPDLREGAAWLAEIKTTQQSRTDIKELRAHHPDIVEQFTHPTPITRVVLSGITSDGEIVSARKLRSA